MLDTARALALKAWPNNKAEMLALGKTLEYARKHCFLGYSTGEKRHRVRLNEIVGHDHINGVPTMEG